MKETFEMSPIGVVESCYEEKFCTPRQANLVSSAKGRIKLYSEFADEGAFIGLEGVSHIWLQFLFHQNRDHRWRPKIRPPRFGGNERIGVFASRSPYRPNALGLSAVRYCGVERLNGVLYVLYSGGDLVNGTPVLDIKPYLPYSDCLPDAVNRMAPVAPQEIPVVFSQDAHNGCVESGGVELKKLITEVLAQDPRPQYHKSQGDRTYRFEIAQCHVEWQVQSSESTGSRVLVNRVSKTET